MSFNRILSAVGAIALAATSFAQIKWAPDYRAALDQARAGNKIVMVEFYAPWDLTHKDAPKWSGRLERETFTARNVQDVVQKFVSVRLDVEGDGKAQAQKFKITKYPTVLFLDKDEHVVGVIDGFEEPEDFVKHANVFLKDHADYPGAEAKYKANPKNLDAITRLGEIYANRYQLEPALAKLGEAEAVDPKNGTDKLTDLYNAIADHYQNAANYMPAVKYFTKAVETSKNTDKRAYGYLSIATCYLTIARPETKATVAEKLEALKKVIPAAEACLKLPGLKPVDRDLAQTYISVAKQALNEGG